MNSKELSEECLELQEQYESLIEKIYNYLDKHFEPGSPNYVGESYVEDNYDTRSAYFLYRAVTEGLEQKELEELDLTEIESKALVGICLALLSEDF